MNENNLQSQFVTYEIALALKELGFVDPCFGYFKPNGHLFEYYGSSSLIINCNTQAPLWQQVIDWFNKEYDIKFTFPYWSNSNNLPECMRGKYDCAIFVADGKAITVKTKMGSYYFDEPYEAREQAILKAIELCQKEK